LPPDIVKEQPSLEQGSVDTLKTTSSSTSFAMSGSLKDGSINIWSTNLGMNLAGGFNFKKQAHLAPSKLAEKEKLSYLAMKKYGGEDENSAHMYLRSERFESKQPKAEEAIAEEKKVEAPQEEEQVESELFGACFKVDESSYSVSPLKEAKEDKSVIDLDEDFEYLNDNFAEVLISVNEALITELPNQVTPTP
jgi:hypothetical protein